ncbi:sodium- and chloride-dependent glycine transporter 2-like isoform X2 [Ptychodera flava]|uniref:sodium- and chloride-dependent glycine transporter 2-like isoform X2 n=1 Tax=Ptychodera flava TaxID=63121 RepID=UPI003969FF19
MMAQPLLSVKDELKTKQDELKTKQDIELRERGQAEGETEDENVERGNWSRKAEFILSCLGYAVGLGNLWRFPYLCFSNGGGAFLIPYVIMLFFVGMPVFLLELTLGQYASQGCIGVWKCCPLFKGIGYAMVILSSLVAIYYNVVMCWAVYFTFASFTALPSLPWVGCMNDWNTETCYDDRDVNATIGENATVTSASDEYFSIYTLEKSKGIDDTGPVVWKLALCLLLAWVIVFFTLVKGVKSVGKVVYFTATFPYLVLLILLIRGVTLPGASEGIKFYMMPQWERLGNAKVWKDAATQIFFSLSAANGGLHVVASYNKFHNNVYLDASIIPLMNCGTSVFAGFAIFSVLGFMAHETGKEVKDVVESGIGLTFIAYPEALSRLPISPLWAVLFFIMLITLGVGSLVVYVETTITSLHDEFEVIRRLLKGRRWILPLVVCSLFYLLGLLHVTQSGIYWLALQDNYAAGVSVVFIGLIELLAVTYIYGFRNLIQNIKTMVGERSRLYWMSMYFTGIIPMFIAPFLITFVLIFYFIDYKPITLGSYEYPRWADPGIAWLMVMASVGAIFFYMVYHIILREQGPILKRLRNSLNPHPQWGPMLEQHRIEAGISRYVPTEEK